MSTVIFMRSQKSFSMVETLGCKIKQLETSLNYHESQVKVCVILDIYHLARNALGHKLNKL